MFIVGCRHVHCGLPPERPTTSPRGGVGPADKRLASVGGKTGRGDFGPGLWQS